MLGGCIGIVASVVAFSHIELVEIVTDRELITKLSSVGGEGDRICKK